MVEVMEMVAGVRGVEEYHVSVEHHYCEYLSMLGFLR
jgi:hypothetical protein